MTGLLVIEFPGLSAGPRVVATSEEPQ
jgi:hypothetical protein